MGFTDNTCDFRWTSGALRLLLAAAMMLTGARFLLSAAETQEVSDYTTHIEPILQANCVACHTGAGKMGGLLMDSHEALMKGGDHGPVVVPGKSSVSRMVLMLEGKIKPQMPFGGKPLPRAEIDLIKAWIDAGAKGPPAGAPSAVTAHTPVIPDIKPQVSVVSPVTALAFSPDGKILAVGGYKEVRLMDASSGKFLTTLSGHADAVRALAFSPDGTKLAAAGGLPARSGEIKIWDVGAQRLLQTLAGHNDCIYSVAVSSDGKLLASSSYDKLVKLWDLEAGKELRTLKDHIDAVFAVTFSPDGKRLASGAADRTVKFWDVATGQRLFTLSDPLDGVTTVAFHPSGNQLAAAGADKWIRTWNLKENSGTLAQSMIAHADVILRIAYSPDGKSLVSTSADRTIMIWEAQTLAPVKVLERQADWVEAMSISPDGNWLAAGRYDGTVSVYDLTNYQQVLGPLSAFETYRAATQAEVRQPADP